MKRMIFAAVLAAVVVIFAAAPAAAQRMDFCRQAEILQQEYFAARGEYSGTRSGWNRTWETARDAGLGALITRGTTSNWRTIAQVAGFVGAGSVVKQEITGWRSRKSLKELRADMLVAQAACDRQEKRQPHEQESDLREELQSLREELRGLRQQPQPVPSAPAAPAPPPAAHRTVENCFERTIVAVRTGSEEKILHPGQRAEVAGQPEFWSWTGREWMNLEQRFIHPIAGGWQIY